MHEIGCFSILYIEKINLLLQIKKQTHSQTQVWFKCFGILCEHVFILHNLDRESNGIPLDIFARCFRVEELIVKIS